MATSEVSLGQQQHGQPYYVGQRGDTLFRSLNSTLQASLRSALTPGEKTPLFTVGTDGLSTHFLESFEHPAERQYHNCHCCRTFIRRYGGAVTLDADGNARSVLWDPLLLSSGDPPSYHLAVQRLKRLVESKPVISRFHWESATWGIPEAGGFSHFCVHMFPSDCRNATNTPFQEMAGSKQDFIHLQKAFADPVFSEANLRQAIAMLEAGSLERASSFMPIAEFLLNTRLSASQVREERRRRRLWYAVGQAAAGWCTPRTSALGALLSDIALGRPVNAIVRSHNARVAPLAYQRPKAPPKAGNIARAETVFEQLGLAPALERRPLLLEEAELDWRPSAPQGSTPGATGGVFDHLRAGSSPSGTLLGNRAVRMTFAKFQRDFLPKVRSMQMLVPAVGAFTAMTTAVNPHAPPLLRWDRPERRNPASWYLYVRGSGVGAAHWGLTAGAWVDVLGICRLPPEWYDSSSYTHLTDGRKLFILSGARDSQNRCLALFPECMRNELHEVRATIEAHSKSRSLHTVEGQRATGYLLGENSPAEVYVQTDYGKSRYLIDRID